jgi:hypothetical protein
VGSRDPIARFCGALFAGLNGQTKHRGLELSSEHNPNPSSSCIAKGQFGNGRLWEYSPLAWKRRDMLFCCATSYMIHLQKKITQVRFGTALLHELASLYMYAIFRCSSRHAVDRQNRGKVPQTAGLLLARMQREKDFACSCTPTSPQRKKTRCVACLRSCRSDFRFGQRFAEPLVLVACLDFPMCAIFSNSPALPITKAVSLHRQPPPKIC